MNNVLSYCYISTGSGKPFLYMYFSSNCSNDEKKELDYNETIELLNRLFGNNKIGCIYRDIPANVLICTIADEREQYDYYPTDISELISIYNQLRNEYFSKPHEDATIHELSYAVSPDHKHIYVYDFEKTGKNIYHPTVQGFIYEVRSLLDNAEEVGLKYDEPTDSIICSLYINNDDNETTISKTDESLYYNINSIQSNRLLSFYE